MGINLGMTRLYGWSLKGERIIEYVPDVRFERTSVIAAIGLDGYVAPLTYKNTLDGDFFTGYVEECLAPALNKGDILIMDNATPHKADEAIATLTKKGIIVMWLPQYSPDMNPIEISWSKVKGIIKKLKPRTYDDLMKALTIAFESISEEDIRNWFKHDGYFFNPSSLNV